MSWTKEPPTTPGLYAWCDGRGGKVFTYTFLADGNVVQHTENPNDSRPVFMPRNRFDCGGLWQPLHVELPPAYVPPPKVEVYSAKQKDGDLVWVHVLNGKAYVSTFVSGSGLVHQCGDSFDREKDHYTCIEKVQ